MDRREYIKSMLMSGIAGGALLSGCLPKKDEKVPVEKTISYDYGRTEKEVARDVKLFSESFFNVHEITTIAVLCDLILPTTSSAGSATEAAVPEFIEFIVKDINSHQNPIRSGIIWIDKRSDKLFGTKFSSCSETQQKQLLDEIAYPDEYMPEVKQGVEFFNLMRNLVLTGYYTTKMGIDDLGYKGNSPTIWDGVPEEVLKKHRMEYDPDWIAKCVDQNNRDIIAQWDDQGNLIS